MLSILVHKSLQNTFQKFTNRHLNIIKKSFPDVNVIVLDDVSEVNKLISKADILIPTSPSELGNIDFNKARNLKWVHVISAGINALPKELLDLDVFITNSSGVHPVPISEHVFAFMLMFARSMHKAFQKQSKREWQEDEELNNVFDLAGKTIAIVGLGRIGKRIARLAKAFEMVVLAVKKKDEKYEFADKVYTMENINKVLKISDFVVNCLPSTFLTNKLFDYSKFVQMKKTAYFINIGRGDTVVEKDLIKALKEEEIAGAGLDVFEKEPLSPKSPLWLMENVIITPHSSGVTPYYMDRVIEIFCRNLKAYLLKEKMPNLIDKKKGY